MIREPLDTPDDFLDDEDHGPTVIRIIALVVVVAIIVPAAIFLWSMS